MKKLPIGIQTFEDLIRFDYLYIDKTKSIYELIAAAKGAFFLSRPRRFGKTLLISTLESIFSGKKELFKNLWIYNQEYNWKKYPIIKISFSGKLYEDKNSLKTYIKEIILEIAQDYDIQLNIDKDFDLLFRELIRKLSEIERVVILIDEYDTPILDCIHQPDLAKANRDILKVFYTVIKDADSYLRFAFLTGVSKFSKISVFSGMNNLNDITMDKKYAELLGYTQTEIENYFDDRIDQLAGEIKKPELIAKIKNWYNGYRFSIKEVNVYNPFSSLLFFEKAQFKNYWFETGTPTFLINLIEMYDYDIPKIENLEVPEIAFSSYEIEDLRIEPLLYQTGYITIKDYQPENMLYALGYPNFEVKQAFLEYLTDSASSVRKELAASCIVKLIKALHQNQLDEFFEIMRLFFVNIPYDLQLKHEKYYQTIFYLIFSLIGLRIEAEVKTNKGRIDAVVITKEQVFIFEFKLYDRAKQALAQIKRMKYFEKYQNLDKPCLLIGVEFDPSERNIGEFASEFYKNDVTKKSAIKTGAKD